MNYSEEKPKRRVEETSIQPPLKQQRLEHDKAVTSNTVSSHSGIGHAPEVGIAMIPKTVTRGILKEALTAEAEKVTLVAFDLETTGLIRGSEIPHITQIGAIEFSSKNVFQTYVFPKIPLTQSAKRITGVVVSPSGKMTVNGMEVKPLTIESAMEGFLRWLEHFPNVFLIAHNGRKFDFRVLNRTIKNINRVQEFSKCISGFIDSLDIFMTSFPGRRSYSQENLARTFLRTSYGAHDAVEDAKVLQKLVSYTRMADNKITTFSFPPV